MQHQLASVSYNLVLTNDKVHMTMTTMCASMTTTTKQLAHGPSACRPHCLRSTTFARSYFDSLACLQLQSILRCLFLAPCSMQHLSSLACFCQSSRLVLPFHGSVLRRRVSLHFRSSRYLQWHSLFAFLCLCPYLRECLYTWRHKHNEHVTVFAWFHLNDSERKPWLPLGRLWRRNFGRLYNGQGWWLAIMFLTWWIVLHPLSHRQWHWKFWIPTGIHEQGLLGLGYVAFAHEVILKFLG